MSRKKSAFLESLLNDSDNSVEVDLSKSAAAAAALVSRDNALARMARGEIEDATLVRIDPARCRIWPGNPRIYGLLNEDNCRELIDALIAEGSQRIPAIVRRLKDDPEFEYEVIAGNRRHFAISWLRANGYPDFRFLAEVRSLGDEEAYRLAQIENRGRNDTSEYERALSYKDAVERYYNGNQSRMAERLRLSNAQLSKLLAIADLPAEVVAAFPSPLQITIKSGYEVSQLLRDPAKASRVLSEASIIASEQEALRVRGMPPIEASAVARRLAASARDSRGAQRRSAVLSVAGRPMMSIVADRATGLTLTLHADSQAELDEVLRAVEQAWRNARINQKKLKK